MQAKVSAALSLCAKIIDKFALYNEKNRINMLKYYLENGVIFELTCSSALIIAISVQHESI
jgi:hypothetical protein